MKRWLEDGRQALEQLAAHKLRTFLTLLGMIFGVGAVIAMLSVGEGAEREALKMIDTMGLRNILVQVKPVPDDMLAEVREDSLGLTVADLTAARETLPYLEADAGLKRVRTFNLFSNYAAGNASVVGVDPDYFELVNLEPAIGRNFTEIDNRLGARVCILGARAAADLFGNRSPLGETVKINHLWFTVVGILQDRGLQKDEFEGVKLGSTSNQIYLPLQTVVKKFAFKPMEDELDEFLVKVEEGVSAQSAALTLSRLLESRHRGVDDFEIVVPESLLEQHRKTQRIFNIVMSAVAGISLLVGGIGIMNIMLAGVLERTREIGIRRALGAKRGDIKRLFMIEAFMVSALGGVLGIGLGFLLADGIARWSGWAVAWSMKPVLLSVGVCAVVGLVFGIYPAAKAAKLNPIDALRHD